jgi:hypothetical protein
VPAASSNPSPRYFNFSSKDEGLFVSGWFEPDREFPGVDARWKETAENARNMGIGEPRDVQFAKVGLWDVMSYELHVANLTNTDLFAEYVQAGTWLELQLRPHPPPLHQRATAQSSWRSWSRSR